MRKVPGYNSASTVSSPSSLHFKIADDPAEFEQIFQLAYDTFVEEIPQHAPNGDRRHLDRFHEENTYIVARQGDDVVGMIALRGDRPFSLDQKLDNLDEYLPTGRRVCELRLLAVRPAYRRGMVFKGLVDGLVREGRQRGYDMAVISGTLRQEKLYRHLGFVPFGPRVGTDQAPFQPMYLTFEGFLDAAPAVAGEPASFLPGPVPLTDHVRAAFQRAPVGEFLGVHFEIEADGTATRGSGKSSAGRARGSRRSSARRTSRFCSGRARSPTTPWPPSSRSSTRRASSSATASSASD